MVLVLRAPHSPSSERIRALTSSAASCRRWRWPPARVRRAPTTSPPTKSSGITPSGTNLSEARPFNDVERPWMEPGAHFIGRKAKKALYREYTDDTFSTLKPRPSEWEHLGFLGPLVRAEVGDTIRVVFRNNTPGLRPPARCLLCQGFGRRALRGRDGIETERTMVCRRVARIRVWPVPERAGPTEHEGSSAFWMYHSHHDEIRDVASGLIGPLIVTRKGMARPDSSPVDVDREIVAGFIEVDENSSWHVEENIATYTTDPKGVRIGRNAFGDLVVLPQVRPNARGYRENVFNPPPLAPTSRRPSTGSPTGIRRESP